MRDEEREQAEFEDREREEEEEYQEQMELQSAGEAQQIEDEINREQNETNRAEKPKMKFFRSTILKSYLRCPYRFKMEWISGLKGHFPEAVHRGSRLHKALELYIKEGREQAIKCLVDNKDRELFNKIDEIMLILPEGGEILSEYSFKEHFVGLPEMRGTFDIVMIDKEQVRIIDLKTGWNCGKYDGLQMAIYLMAGKQIWKPRKVSIAMWILRRGEIRESGNDVSREYIETLVKTIEEDIEFKPNSSYQSCKECPYELVCERRYKPKRREK